MYSDVRPERKTVSESSLLLIGVPREFVHKSLKDFKCYDKNMTKVRDFVKDYLLHLPRAYARNSGILFCGSNGVGKSFLASLIVKEAYKERFTARRVDFTTYLKIYTSVWSAKREIEKADLEENLYTYYKAVHFLVLEEIGKEIDSKIATPILEDLLRYREENGLPTIICTNLSLSNIHKKYGESVYSLLNGNTVPVVIEGLDMRVGRGKK